MSEQTAIHTPPAKMTTGEPWDLASPLGIQDAARAVGLDPGDYDTHTALGDARLARDIHDVVMGVKEANSRG